MPTLHGQIHNNNPTPLFFIAFISTLFFPFASPSSIQLTFNGLQATFSDWTTFSNTLPCGKSYQFVSSLNAIASPTLYSPPITYFYGGVSTSDKYFTFNNENQAFSSIGSLPSQWPNIKTYNQGSVGINNSTYASLQDQSTDFYAIQSPQAMTTTNGKPNANRECSYN